MSHGNSRQAVFRDDADRQKLRDDLKDTVVRCGWELFAFFFMPNQHVTSHRSSHKMRSFPQKNGNSKWSKVLLRFDVSHILLQLYVPLLENTHR